MTIADKRHLSEDEISEYKSAFNLLDRDHNGKVSVADLKKALSSFGRQKSDEELARLISTCNPSHNVAMDFEDFLTMMERPPTPPSSSNGMLESREYKKEMRNAFREFDVSGDGKISRDELGEMLGKLGMNISSDEVESMMKEADKDGNGTVDFEEFLEVMSPGNPGTPVNST